MNEEEKIKAAEMQMMMAAVRHDADAFAAICHPDYRTVNEDGSAGDLLDVVAEMRTNPLQIGAPPEASENLIRQAGDLALVSGRWKFRAAENVDREIRYVEVWARHNGEWKFLHWQATRITPEGAEREKKFKAAVRP